MNRKPEHALHFLYAYECLAADGLALRNPQIRKNKWVRTMSEYGRQANVPLSVTEDCAVVELALLGKERKGAWKRGIRREARG